MSESDFRLAAIGIPGIKAVLDTLQPGLGGYVRTPLQPFTKEALGKSSCGTLAACLCVLDRQSTE